MKKIFFRLLYVLLVCAVFACSKENEKPDIEKLSEQIMSMQSEYMEACSERDYDRARGIVDKMGPLYAKAVTMSKAILDNLETAAEAKHGYDVTGELWDEYTNKLNEYEGKFPSYSTNIRYVNDKEIYYLLSKPSRDNNARILYLYNSYETEELPDMNDVIEVAISMGNDELSEKLIKSGVDPNLPVAKAVINADMVQLFDLIINKHPEYILNEEIGKYYKKEKGFDAYKTFLSDLFIKSDKDERERILDIGKAENINEVSKWINYQNEEKRKELKDELNKIISWGVSSRPALGVIKSDYYGDIPNEYTSYRNDVERYNNELKELISKCIDLGETNLANKALSQMKPNLEWKNLGDWEVVVAHSGNSSVCNAYRVSENQNEINEARKIIKLGKR